MPATVLADPPGIRCMFSDGSTAEFRLEGLPCPQLVSDLLTGLGELIHPHGSLDSANSVDLCLPPIRNLARGLAAQGFSGGAAELGRGVLIEYWMATRKFRWEAFIRRMLRGYDTATDRLDPGVRELLTGRAYTPAPHRQALPPYSETEWDRLTTVCKTIVSESYTTHRQALTAAARGRTPTIEEWTSDNLVWCWPGWAPWGRRASPSIWDVPSMRRRNGVGSRPRVLQRSRT